MRIGSLCSGYGGLDLGAQAVLGGTVAWHVEYDPNASRILAHHWPNVPNLGDLTAVDWTQVEPVDVLTAGYPCQPFSHAGQRKGSADVRHLWPHVARAISVLRPRLVLLENVRGHVSLGLDAVIGDLSRLGYDARWALYELPTVEPPTAEPESSSLPLPTPRATRGGSGTETMYALGGTRDDTNRTQGEVLLPTPTVSDTNGPGQHGDGGPDLRTAMSLLPTPNPFHLDNTETVDGWIDRRAEVQKRTGTRHGPALPVVALSIHEGRPLYQAGDGPTLWHHQTDDD